MNFRSTTLRCQECMKAGDTILSSLADNGVKNINDYGIIQTVQGSAVCTVYPHTVIPVMFPDVLF